MEAKYLHAGATVCGLLAVCLLASPATAQAQVTDDDKRFVPDYFAVLDNYVDPASARDANYGIGGSLVAGYMLNQQIAAEVKAFGAGLDRHRPGAPFVIGAGGDIKASGRYGFFVSGGGGFEYGSVDNSHRASPYVDVGGGWEHRLLPDLSLRLEASYRLLSNAGNRGGFGGELWAGAGVVIDMQGRRYREMAARPERSVEVVPVRCARPPEGLSVNDSGELIPQDSRTIAVDFATNSAVLDAPAQAEIAQLAAALLCGTAQQLAVQVVGHADIRGDAVYNVKLSQRRADSVRDALIADGVSPDRIGIDAAGKYELLKKGNNPSVNQLNRKIEIKLYPGVTPG